MSEILQVSLDDKGAILLPERVRERLHLSPGMTLVVEKGEQGGVRLRVEKKPQPVIEMDGILVAQGTALRELGDITRLERERRVLELVQRTGL